MGTADVAITSVTDDGSFRVVTARTTDTVQEAVRAQDARGSTAVHLANLITGAALVRLTMAPDLRVQGVVRGLRGKGTIVADCYPDGSCRGLVRETAGPIQVGPGSLMQLMCSLPNGSLHQGVVEVPGSYGISGALMVYMLESEQVTSVIGVGCVLGEREQDVAVAGGWIVQLLPECTEPPLELMYARMRTDFADIDGVLAKLGADPVELQNEILWGIPFRTTGTDSLSHRCGCSETRVLASLATLGHSELEDIVHKGETLDISCDYCRRPYRINPELLRGLLEAS